MTKVEAYAALVAARRKQLGVRLGIAVFIGAAAFFLAPSRWPMIWFGVVLATQLLEFCLSRWLVRVPDRIQRPGVWVGILMMTTINSATYVGICAYLWFCGSAGLMFAIMVLCGSLLHVCLHFHMIRSILIAAMVGQSAFLVVLPLATAVIERTTTPAPLIVMLISAALYVGHLVIGVMETTRINRALSDANEAAEQQRGIAEAASRSKSDFLATISHEIRTPLNAVTTASHLLRTTATSDAQKEYIQILDNGSEVLLGLINQVLDMSKIEAGKMLVDVEDVDLPDLTARLIALWRPKAREAGLTLTLELDPDLPRMIRSDGLRLNQILFNLIANAVKFTPDGTITLSIGQDADWLEIRVTDTGPGMTPEVLSRLFNSFEQADSGITRMHGGSGLGLAISSRLARLMGGHLSVESTPGQGSTFRLALPLIVSAPDARVETASAGPYPSLPSNRLSILLAEDHPVNRRLVALLLEPLDCDLVTVDNGAEAVEAATLDLFDVILMDMQMPIMDGLEATRRITRSASLNATTPIIALTANAFDDQRDIWLDAGAFDFLTKPIDPAALMAAVLAAAAFDRPLPNPERLAS